ncbi:mitochondrial tRNA methylthiotransferase CDK5RAP1-like [Ruditapes philippinarum]|uniref:mitochondrial tRNA methylthiotransferase CDK5RAP1-like n=1 Tax=Ruditapes philippinarum TaxID=129788 RepID=UPI00295C25B4|nr:mitochondrial tRNA methylthiotransferase CDK5RAP1-like [Ruditapes philippinarum]
MLCGRAFVKGGAVVRHFGRVLKTTTCLQFRTLTVPADVKSKEDKVRQLQKGPSLEHFIANSTNTPAKQNVCTDDVNIPYLNDSDLLGNGRNVYFDVHGCQMNTNDMEIAWSILQEKGYQRTNDMTQADVVLVMTCAIREGAEQKIWRKLKHLTGMKRRGPLKKGGVRMKIGILGCMAERLKTQILEKEKLVDIVCGPDAYRDLPRLLAVTNNKQSAVNVLLSLEETYADVMPVRLNEDSVTAYVSIMRGCDNMCSYCIVPFTRGRERSRPIDSILDEVRMLSDQGVKEVTLLGQNVNSYRDISESSFYGAPDRSQATTLRDGFKTVYKPKSGGRRFADLLDKVSEIDKDMRIRFTAAHPKDFPDEVLQLIKERGNICNQLHLPAQSGNNEVLQAMRRGYTVEAYRQLVDHVQNLVPGVALTSDFICGFCGETEEAHQQTLQLIRDVKYSMVFCFPYSMRQKTNAYHKLKDDVTEDDKKRRHLEMKEVFKQVAGKLTETYVGQVHTVLVEGVSKKDKNFLFGRNDAGLAVIFPDNEILDGNNNRQPKAGDYVDIKIENTTSQTLYGSPVKITNLFDSEDSEMLRELQS